jgi:hypothetical protein
VYRVTETMTVNILYVHCTAPTSYVLVKSLRRLRMPRPAKEFDMDAQRRLQK